MMIWLLKNWLYSKIAKITNGIIYYANEAKARFEMIQRPLIIINP